MEYPFLTNNVMVMYFLEPLIQDCMATEITLLFEATTMPCNSEMCNLK